MPEREDLLTITPRTLRQIARDIQRGLPKGTSVVPFASIPYSEARSVSWVVRPGSRLTAPGIARRFLRAITREKLMRFAKCDKTGATVSFFDVTSRRFSIRAYEDFNLYRCEMAWRLDVIGDKGGQP